VDSQGRVRWVRDDTAIVRDLEGGVTHFQGIVLDVTAAREAEAALQESEARFRSLYENAAVGMVVADLQGHFTSVNQAFAAMLGYRPEELGGLHVREVSHPEEWPAEAAQIRRLTSGETDAVRLAKRFRHRSGSWTWGLVSGSLVRDAAGRPSYVVAHVQDITPMQEAREALQQERNHLEAITRSIGAGLAVIDRSYRTQWANRVIRDLFGDVVGKPCHLTYNQAEGICPGCGVREIFEEGRELVVHEQHGRDAAGEEIWSRIVATPIRDAQGEVTAAMELVVPITDRKRAELALEAEKERLAVTLASIGDGVITTDTAGRILMMNRVAEDLTGWSQAEALGKDLPQVFRIVHEQTRRPCDNPARQVLDTGQAAALGNHTLLIPRDGRERVIADSGAPIRDRQGRIIGVVLVFRDETVKRRTAREMEKIQKLESLGVLAGGIAHDFNNFLTGIMGNLSLARLEADSGEPLAERLAEIERVALRAKELTQQLLTFSRGGEPVKTLTRMGPLVRDAVSFALRGSSARCELDLPEDLWPARVDPGQVNQVIQNVVLNAVQAMPGGGVVAVRGANLPEGACAPAAGLPPGPYVRLTVTDHGVGIPPDLLVKVVDPYFTTKPMGSGLGLTVAHAVAEKHAGRLVLESSPGEGTTCHVYLPARPGEAVPGPGRPAAGGRGRVLVMDDEGFIRDLARRMLERLGYRVDLARDGEEALECHRRARDAGDPFDLVIMDLTIPGGMGGREAIQRLREVDPGVRALVSSGYSNDPVMSRFQDHGFAGVVLKPYRLEELAAALEAALMAQP
jgi:PAS domain S-box-containing protein